MNYVASKLNQRSGGPRFVCSLWRESSRGGGSLRFDDINHDMNQKIKLKYFRLLFNSVWGDIGEEGQ